MFGGLDLVPACNFQIVDLVPLIPTYHHALLSPGQRHCVIHERAKHPTVKHRPVSPVCHQAVQQLQQMACGLLLVLVGAQGAIRCLKEGGGSGRGSKTTMCTGHKTRGNGHKPIRSLASGTYLIKLWVASLVGNGKLGLVWAGHLNPKP